MAFLWSSPARGEGKASALEYPPAENMAVPVHGNVGATVQNLLPIASPRASGSGEFFFRWSPTQ